MKYTRVVFILIVIFSVVSVKSFSQTKEELQKRKLQTEEDIRTTNTLLEQIQRTKATGLNKLLIIKKRIVLREQLINEMSEEINLLGDEIVKKEEKIVSYESDLRSLKEEYAKMIYFAYKNKRNYDRIMFILAAEDFNQAYRRMKYLQQYTKYRKKQAEKIFITQKNLAYEIEQLKEDKSDKVVLLSKKEKEKMYLTGERNRENLEVARLKQKEGELRKRIRENERIRKQLENTIRELIAREAASNKTYKSLSADEELISQSFKSLKGNLKWPVDNGVVLKEFGEHPHPVFKGIMQKNDGIDIGSSKDAKVRAIYKGEIKKVFAVPGANMAVIVRHGHYLSLYSNIVNVRVKPGDLIDEGHYLGDIYNSDYGEGNSVLHLGIYEEMEALNPIHWIRKM